MQKHKSFEEIFKKKGIVICRREDREKTSQAARKEEANLVVSAAREPPRRGLGLPPSPLVRGTESGPGRAYPAVCGVHTAGSGRKMKLSLQPMAGKEVSQPRSSEITF